MKHRPLYWRSSRVLRVWDASTWLSCSCRPQRRNVSLFDVRLFGVPYSTTCDTILMNAAPLFFPLVVKELFDFLHQAELEASSVSALQKKYGVWRLDWSSIDFQFQHTTLHCFQRRWESIVIFQYWVNLHSVQPLLNRTAVLHPFTRGNVISCSFLYS